MVPQQRVTTVPTSLVTTPVVVFAAAHGTLAGSAIFERPNAMLPHEVISFRLLAFVVRARRSSRKIVAQCVARWAKDANAKLPVSIETPALDLTAASGARPSRTAASG